MNINFNKNKFLYLVSIFLLFGLMAFADSPYARRIYPVVNNPTCTENQTWYNMTIHKFYICTNAGAKEVAIAGGGLFAPVDATYITQTSNGTLTNEQALSGLATGILKNTTTTGVLSIGGVSDVDSILPTQTANSGKYLTTNGTVSSWGTISVPVTSVFTRTGAVVAAANDYNFNQLAGTATYSQLVLTGAILNADLAGSITYSKLSLTNSVISGDIVSLVWSKVTGTPTTFSGYGISDTSANFFAAITNETGSGLVVGSISPTFTGTVVLPLTTISVGNTTSATTDLLVNPTTKASGNFIDLQVNGSSRFSISAAGVVNLLASTQLNLGNLQLSSSAIDFSSSSSIGASSGGTSRALSLVAGGTAGGFYNLANAGLLRFGGSTSSANIGGIGWDAVNGFTLQSGASSSTWNDNSTAGSGTVANRYLFGIAAPILTATNSSVTNTVASTFYIGGAPTDSTNITSTTKWALNVAAGNTNLGGTLSVSGAVNGVVLKGGTPGIAGNGTLNTGSKDFAGKVTATGTGASTIVLTFSTAFSNAPACMITNETTANLVRPISTTTTLTVSATIVSGDSLSYICAGY